MFLDELCKQAMAPQGDAHHFKAVQVLVTDQVVDPLELGYLWDYMGEIVVVIMYNTECESIFIIEKS